MNVRRLWILLFFFLTVPAYAQVTGLVSPGELSKAHEKFSGVKNCNVCHGGKKEVLEEKCLACHKNLQAQIAARKGFHADKSTGCVKCHTEHLGKDFNIRPFDTAKFDHKQTGYSLTGKHLDIACAACHKTRSFLGLKTDCQSCHKDPHRGRLLNCESCHSTDRPFKQAAFDHSTTRFPLEGAHAKVACMTCHKDQVFRGLPFASCASCHKDPHQGKLGDSCLNCHTITTWKSPKVAHKTFPLEGKHASVACAKCHVNNQWKLKSFSKCADCHKDPHKARFGQIACEQCHTVQGFKPSTFNHETLQKQNVSCVSCHVDKHAGQMGTKCEQCHTTTTFKIPKFDHTKTRFPLDQVHQNLACEKCHKTDAKTGMARYKPLPITCAECHGDVHLGQFSAKCESCHSPTGLVFDHSKTSYPLTGKHVTLECAKCHHKETGKFPGGQGETIRYKFASLQCATCHEDYHHGQFKQDCASCHTTAGFKPSKFDHRLSMFPLTGAHLNLSCEKCHKTEMVGTAPPAYPMVRYKIGSAQCSSCHQDPHSGRFGNDCQKCHDTSEWKSVSRAFHKQYRFPLEGKHLSIRCEDCHWKGQLAGTPMRCYDCHWIRRQDDLYRTQLGTNCEDCHQPSSWTAVQWNHAARTGVALGPHHSTLNCDACHIGGNFTQPPTGCYTCHQADYASTTAPSHTAAGFPTTCENCHRPADKDWQTLSFNHSTVYPLLGVHRTIACVDCHKNNQYQGIPTDCYGCHKADYQNTKDPNHQQAGFSTQCESCHQAGDNDWHHPGFNHSAVFPLVGVHATIACSACHKNGVYAGTPRDCYGCHKSDYQQTTDPNHVKSNFPTTCEACHKASDPNWNQASFDHNRVFPLVGVHKTLTCNQCHKNGVYAGTPRQCFGCHKADYNATTNPNHIKANFPTTCEVCHKASDANWNQAKFNHASVFPLLGKHATAPCTDCHKNGVYAGTPRDCYSCHKTQYQQTTNPNHPAAGFPTTCENCHRAGDASWTQGRFTHTWFPIQSGHHAGIPCSTCHTNPSDYKVFQCLSCHPRSQVDPEHQGVGGYVYSSQACYNCHPTGNAGG